MTKRYFIHLAYNGSNFHGWQVQNNAPTVQKYINDGLQIHLQKDINVTGCGRTDTGVHASNFYGHFELNKNLTAAECDDLCFKLNRFLPIDIVVFGIYPMKDRAHARFDAISRTYKYFITRRKDPFFDDYSY